MLLKRLELLGYKTFALRTELEFNSGITAIVGPNGSGKSNIADAIRWVLGEQRQTSLRIKRTEDLIFAGSGQRSRQGMAEVAITLDNSTHWLPLEYTEVMITRRVFRSGESEYLLNGTRMRSRDIIEILEKGGLSKDDYLVIGQGLVDAALSLRPIERRSLFEAAAGIKLYQAKKEEALRKLEETKQNLVRINDILNEIAPRLAALQTQAQRAEEHALLSQDLAELLRLWYGYHWQRQAELLQEAEARYAELTEFIVHQETTVTEIAQQAAELGAEQAKLRQDLSTWHQRSSTLHAQIEERDRHLAVSQERHRLLLSQKADLEAETTMLEPQRAEHEAENDALQKEMARLHGEREEASAKLQQLRRRWEEEKQQRETLERELERARERSFQVATMIADCRNRLLEIAERRADLQREQQKTQESIGERKAALDRLSEAMQFHLKREKEVEEAIANSEAEIARVRDSVKAGQARYEMLERDQQRIQREIATLRARQRMLQRMRQELSGYYAGVRTVIQAAGRGELAGVLGPVVRLMRIAPELDAAIEVALGAHLQDIVVERWADAEAAIALLKESRGGRATFLPLDSIRPPQPCQVPKGEGILGLASQLVQFEERYKAVFDLLLGHTIIVTDLQAARRLLRWVSRSPQAANCRLVTLEGELVLATGSLSGGSQQETDSKIALERDWQEIPKHLSALESKFQERGKEKRQEEEARQRLTVQLDALERRQADLRRAHQAEQEERAGLERQLARLQDEIALYDTAVGRFTQELEGLAAKEQGLRAQQEVDEKQQAALADSLASLQARRDVLDSESLPQELATAEAALAIAMRNEENQRRLLDNQRLTLQRLGDQIGAKRQRIAELEAAIQQAASHIQELQIETQALRKQLNELRAVIESAESEISALDKRRNELRQSEEETRYRLRELESRAQQALLDKRLRQDELDRLQRQIEDDLGPVVLPQRYTHQLRLALGQREIALPAAGVLPENLEADIRELRARLRRIGAVNPNAPDEYREVSERYAFLSSQAGDLEKASQSLRDVIAELDEIMEQEFQETFAAVAREFTHYFTLLFGGGTAKLVLTASDEENEAGVEIIARPPGKRLQSLALLSGGERALTAAALLFAILKARPLPFCVLDEVDAMLDEVNVGRFRDILQEMSKSIQFVVITHNRQTIDAANTIYGISLRQDGVSTALSLQLDEAEREIASADRAKEAAPIT